MPTLALRSQRVVTPEGERAATLLIENGRIAELLPYDAETPGATLLDVGHHAVLPGVIDPHVHINEPGRTDWEGFDTATRAALAGGLTTLVDMPLNSAPVTTSVANLEIKRAATQGQLHCNVGFWGGVVPGNAHEIEPMIAAGVLGFKAFLTHSGIDDFPNATEDDLRQVMPVLARHGLPLLVHCELSEDNDAWKQNDHRSYPNYLASLSSDSSQCTSSGKPWRASTGFGHALQRVDDAQQQQKRENKGKKGNVLKHMEKRNGKEG